MEKAIRDDNIILVRKLLEEKADPTCSSTCPWIKFSNLHLAVHQPKCIELLLEKKADPSKLKTWTDIYTFARRQGQYSSLKILLDHVSTDPPKIMDNLLMSIHQPGTVADLMMLVQLKANISGKPIPTIRAYFNSIECIEYLICQKADINKNNTLSWAITTHWDDQIVRILLEAKADITPSIKEYHKYPWIEEYS